jgi:hypothetical protein
MNKLILTALGVAAAFAAQAQGVFNANNNYTPTGAAGRAFVVDVGGANLSKATGKVEFVLPDGTSLTPGGSAGVSLAADGLFFINGVTVPGVAVGGNANIIVRAWDSATGATYDAALERASVAVTVTGLGGGTTPPATFALNSNFTGLTLAVVPEPSTYALAAAGAVGLFLVARRKK